MRWYELLALVDGVWAVLLALALGDLRRRLTQLRKQADATVQLLEREIPRNLR